MRRNLAAFAVSMLWACACGEGLAQPTSTIIDDRAEIEEHLLSPRPVARTDWKEEPSLSAQAEGGAWGARIIVDEAGAVSAVRIVWGRRENRAEAEAAARALRFTPFEREGRAVRAEFSYYIEALPQDYSGPLDRTFPEDDDLSDIRIRLVRTGCYGSCPDYEIEIAGDGSVVYRGGAFALIRGEHRWRIPQTSVLELIQYFRGADYFNLRGHYRIRATHLPTYITALQIGRRRKFVLNYGRFIVGAISSTVFASTDDQMLAPLAVVEIESAIDRLSGTDAWVRGSEKTVAALRAEGWNFRSREGGRAVAHLTIDCNLALAGGFMAEGARVTERIDEGWLNGKTAIAAAPRCGDIGFVRELIRRGAVRNRAVARSFLWASAASGRPGMVAEALRHSRAVNQRTSDGETLLMAAVGALTPDEGDPRAGEHDIAATVGLLLAAGANARVRNDEGEGALHMVDNAVAARALIQAGGDPNARDGEGRTPLFDKYDAETVRVLMEAGADPNVRDGDGQTRLFSAYNAEVVHALVYGGAQVNVQDARGRTALDHAQNENVAQGLIRAGAQIPDDPTRLRNLISRARNLGWNEFLPVLLRHAEQWGLPSE